MESLTETMPWPEKTMTLLEILDRQARAYARRHARGILRIEETVYRERLAELYTQEVLRGSKG